MVAAEFDEFRHVRQFGGHQGNLRIEVFAVSGDHRALAQGRQIVEDAVTHRQIGLKKRLIAGYQISALAGFGVFQGRQQIVGFLDRGVGLGPVGGGALDLPEGLDRCGYFQSDQKGGAGEPGNEFQIVFHRVFTLRVSRCRPVPQSPG